MADVRKIMARLNAPTRNYESGRSGAPELTAADIAGALGMVSPGLGREVLCALWWPDGASLTQERLGEVIAERVRKEMDARHRRLQAARLELHIASEMMLTAGNRDKQAVQRLSNAVDAAKQECWPWNPVAHVQIREGVLSELRAPNRCPRCQGRGDLRADDLVIECIGCGGRGTVPVSGRSRAERCGMVESTYRRTWRGMYMWLYDQIADAESEAARELARALK